MPRDLRDPQKLGDMLLEQLHLHRKATEHKNMTMSGLYEAVNGYVDVPDYSANPSCIDKYGRPADVKPVWQEIQVV